MHTQPLPYLPLLDFDGTMANTFTPSPNRVGVNEAYESALFEVFGEDVVPLYRKLGGLCNRAPEELVRHLAQHDRSLTAKAREQQRDRLTPDADVAAIAELLVELKLEVLLGEVGEDWPKPCEGFCAFVETLRDLGIEYGIISSGHQPFIKKALATWSLPVPRVLVTDDDVRRWPVDPAERVKPALLPYRLALRQWERSDQAVSPRSPQTLYIGDDARKDGGLATNAGIPFGFFTEDNTDGVEMSRFPPGSFWFSDWTELADFVVEHQKDFHRGLPCAEIFRHFGPR